MSFKIGVECWTENYRCYYLGAEISEHLTCVFSKPLQPLHKKNLQKIGKKGRSFVTQVLKIPGIQEILIFPFRFCVRINRRTRSWKEVEPAILEALEKTFRQPKGKTETEHLPPLNPSLTETKEQRSGV